MRPGQPPRAPASPTMQGLATTQCLATTVLVATAALIDDALSQWEWQVNLAVVAVLWWTMRHRTRAVADRSAAGLDERELTTRNRVGWWGYATATAGGTATALVLIIAARVQSVDALSVPRNALLAKVRLGILRPSGLPAQPLQ